MVHQTLFTLMKKRVLFPSAAVGLFSALLVYFVAVDFEAQAQNVERTVSKTVSVSRSDGASSHFAAAAQQNSKLRNSLQWAFGGKAQTGWNIYVSLISHTIGTDSGPETEDFALALSKWQGRSGLTPNGILEQNTLDRLTKYWQSQRLGRAGLQPADILFSAPIVEFYDPTRSPDLLQLERETYAAYKRMIAAAAKDLGLKVTSSGDLAAGEKFLKIVSAYRSQAYQEELRRKEPNAGRVALAKNSPHSTGHALDIYVGGEPVKTEDSNRLLQVQTPAYKWLVKNAAKYGFYPYFYEPWHWEFVPNSANN